VFPLDDAAPPVLVTVCFGANDAVHEGSTMAGRLLPGVAPLFAQLLNIECAR
jgi:hypothetical protein